jgi:PTS system mannose-specific IIA component
MLIKLASIRENSDMVAAIHAAQDSGRKYINVASALLNGE